MSETTDKPGDDVRLLKLPRQYRDAQMDPTDCADNCMTFPFSSETPVERMFGNEILSHDPGAMNMDRISSGAAPLLFNHDPGDPIGMITSAEVKNRRGYATARFFNTPRAQQVRQMVIEGMRNVSVGYSINQARENPKTADFVVTDWTPFEISIATVPADASVGVGRAAAVETEARVTRDPPPEPAGNSEPEAGDKPAFSSASPAETIAAPAATRSIAMTDVITPAAGPLADSAVANDGTQLERLRIRTIHDLCRQHKVDDKTRDEWIDNGMTVDVASSKILDILAERGRNQPDQPTRVGLSNKEIRNYSLNRAIQSILGHGNWDKAGLEFEAHKAIRDKLNRDCGKNSFFVPVEVQERGAGTMEKRDLTVASSPGGGYLVETSNQGFIDILRNRSVAMAMGARRLTGLQGNLTVPKQTAAATAYWLSSESSTITEGSLTLGQMALSPKTVGAYVEISRQLLLQSSPSAEQVTMTDLAAQLALAVDTAAINGSGSSGQPLGILGTSGVGTGPSGTSLDYANVLKFQSDVAGANALTSSCGYVTTPTVAGLLMARTPFTYANRAIWDGSMLDANVAGFRAMSSNQMPTATMLFGDWLQLVIAEWGILEVEINPVANFQAGIVGVRAIYSVDIGVRYAGAFSKVSSIT